MTPEKVPRSDRSPRATGQDLEVLASSTGALELYREIRTHLLRLQRRAGNAAVARAVEHAAKVGGAVGVARAAEAVGVARAAEEVARGVARTITEAASTHEAAPREEDGKLYFPPLQIGSSDDEGRAEGAGAVTGIDVAELTRCILQEGEDEREAPTESAGPQFHPVVGKTAEDAQADWPDHAAVYDEWVAKHGVPIEGMAESWEGYLDQMVGMDWFGHRIYGHRLFLERLHAAEQYATSLQPELSPRAFVRAIGSRSHWRAGERGTSYHVFGMAVDVDAGRNPWVTNPRMEIRRNHDLWVIWRAVWLVGDGAEPVTAADSADRARSSSTEELWSHYHRASHAVQRYFRLLNDASASELAKLVADLGDPPEAIPLEYSPAAHPVEDLREASVERWREVIKADRDGLSRRGGLSAEHGFMNLRIELVRALRDHAGLAWGACDLGRAESGDMMHFDMRNTRFEQLRRAIRRGLTN